LEKEVSRDHKIDSLIRSLIPKVAVLRIQRKPSGISGSPYMKAVSEKYKRIANTYNIRKIFNTKHTLRSTLIKMGPERDPQQRHSASIAFLVNVTEATLAKQADL
jgi:hypothetical protein